MGSSENRKLKVVFLPWLAHGHLTPFIELAKKLSARGFHCYICSTRVNLDSIEKRIAGAGIEPVELRLTASPELPPHYHTTNGLPLHLHKALKRALRESRPEFRRLMESLSPDLLVHDVVIQWAGAAAAEVSVPSVSFHTSGGTMLSYFCHLGKNPAKEFPFPAITLTDFQRSTVFGYLKDAGDAEREDAEEPRDDAAAERKGGEMVMLVNTSRAMEGKYVDYLSELIGPAIVPVGALVRGDSAGGEDADAELMDWLDAKDENSTVLVSFGSEYFPAKEDLQEIAHALEISGANFIWIVRFPKGEEGAKSAGEVLPAGFMERVGGKGRVVEKWAPQAKILSHRSTGGFVSHCGWNSLRESIEFSVPIVALPMHLDQPINAKLVAELGVGVEVGGVGEGVLRREEIAKSIDGVVFGEAGKRLRRRIGELREDVRLKGGEEIDGVVEKLREFCGKV